MARGIKGLFVACFAALVGLAAVELAAGAVTLAQPVKTHWNGAALEWSVYSGGGFQGYEVHRGASSGFTPSSGTLVATIQDVNTTTYRDTGGTPETQYFYKVRVGGTSSNEIATSLPSYLQVDHVMPAEPTAATYIFPTMSDDFCDNRGADARLVLTGENRLLFGFNVPTLPDESLIVDARLSLYSNSAHSGYTAEAAPITSFWREGPYDEGGFCVDDPGATWWVSGLFFHASWQTPGGDFATMPADNEFTVPARSAAGWDELEVESGFLEHNGLPASAGFIVRLKSGAGTTYDSDDSTNPPRLVLTYYEGAPPPLAGTTLGTSGGGNPNFGGKWRWYGYKLPIFGTRVGIKTPASDFGMSDNTLAIFSTVAENQRLVSLDPIQTETKLFQTGFGMTNDQEWSTCGNKSSLTYMAEFGGGDSAFNYICIWLDGPGQPTFQYNHQRMYSVSRISGNCPGLEGAEDRSWQSTIDGVVGMCFRWVNRVQHIRANGEVNHLTSLRRADMSACFACGGQQVWQRAYNVSAGGPSWKTISSARNIPESAARGWDIDPLPGEFKVSLER